jgi:hypothetical protein
MPRGHSENVDLSKRLERISKTIKQIQKIRVYEAYAFDTTKGDPLLRAINTLNGILEDIKP